MIFNYYILNVSIDDDLPFYSDDLTFCSDASIDNYPSPPCT